MFSKLKDKLKKSLSIFSQKVEDEVAEQKGEQTQEEKQPEKKPENKHQHTEKHASTEKSEQTTAEILEEVAAQELTEVQSISEKVLPDGDSKPICDEEKGICLPPELAKMVEPNERKKAPTVKEIIDVLGDLKSTKAEPKESDRDKKKAEQINENIEPAPIEKAKLETTKISLPTEKKADKKETNIDKREPEQKKSFFTRAKEAFTTRTLSEKKFDDLFTALEQTLLENNVAMNVVDKIKEDLKIELVNKPLPRNLDIVVGQTLKQSIDTILSVEAEELFSLVKKKKPFVITFFGINGSGKTTTIAKLAHLLKEQHFTCVLAAGDTFRAAAIQQLEDHANRLNLKIIKHNYGADAAAVAFDTVKYAEKNNVDVVLVDTAGRLHSDTNLMDELKKVVRVVPPDLRLFVGESITGNDCIEQAQKFNEHIGVDAIILTKADVDEKGGTALSMSYVTHKPILYIGTGQSYADLRPFTKDVVLDNLGLS
jgi:fused signal recognition particle receptor